MPSVVREKKPWGGRVYDPARIWRETESAKRNVSFDEFQKGLKENVIARQDKMEKQIQTMEESLKQILEAVTKK